MRSDEFYMTLQWLGLSQTKIQAYPWYSDILRRSLISPDLDMPLFCDWHHLMHKHHVYTIVKTCMHLQALVIVS